MKITFKGTDGSVAIMDVVDISMKEKALKDFHEAHPGFYTLVAEGDIKMPESREHRDAWTISSKGDIIVNKAKAKLIDEARQKELLSSGSMESRLKALESRLNETEK